MDSGGDEMQCDEPGCHHSVPLGEEGCDSEHLECAPPQPSAELFARPVIMVSSAFPAHASQPMTYHLP